MLLGCARVSQVAHHAVGGAGREEVVLEVERGQDAAHSPHANSVAVTEAEEDFWGTEERQGERWMRSQRKKPETPDL